MKQLLAKHLHLFVFAVSLLAVLVVGRIYATSVYLPDPDVIVGSAGTPNGVGMEVSKYKDPALGGAGNTLDAPYAYAKLSFETNADIFYLQVFDGCMQYTSGGFDSFATPPWVKCGDTASGSSTFSICPMNNLEQADFTDCDRYPSQDLSLGYNSITPSNLHLDPNLVKQGGPSLINGKYNVMLQVKMEANAPVGSLNAFRLRSWALDANGFFTGAWTGIAAHEGLPGGGSPIAVQRRQPDPAPDDDFHLRFGVRCDQTALTQFKLHWRDADHALAPGGSSPADSDIRFTLTNVDTGQSVTSESLAAASTWAGTHANFIGGDSEERGDVAHPVLIRSTAMRMRAGDRFEWVWESVQRNNGVVFWLPFDGSNFDIGCPSRASYDHEVVHRIESSTTLVSAGDTVAVGASVCNIGDGIFTPTSTRPLVLRITAPVTTGGKRFSLIDDSYITYQGAQATNIVDDMTRAPSATYPDSARWEIRNVAGVPEDGSGGPSSCDGNRSDGNGSEGYGAGRGWASVKYKVPIDAVPGQRYCFNAITTPGSGLAGPPSTVITASATSGTQSCFEIVNRPYFKLQGADVWSGAVWASQIGSDSNGNCDANALSNVNFDAEDGDIYGNNLGTVGSSGQYGVFGLGNTRVLSADTALVPVGYSGTTGGVLRTIPMMFSNAINGSFLTGDSNWPDRGYFHSTGANQGTHDSLYSPRCVDDYYKRLDQAGQTANFSTSSFQLANPPVALGTKKAYKYTGLAPLNISRPATSNYEVTDRVTIISTRDVIITSSLYTADPYVSDGKLHFPQLTIITKGADIKIRSNIGTIPTSNEAFVEARMIAMPNSSGVGGNLYTCVNTFAQPIFSLSTTVCNRRLRIDGQVFANNIYLQRTGGATYGLFQLDPAAPSSPATQLNYAAELLDYRPQDLLLAILFGQKEGATLDGSESDPTLPDISLLKELPPIY